VGLGHGHGVRGVDRLRSLTGCYRPDCVVLVSGCHDAVSVLTDRDAVSVRVLLRIVSGLSDSVGGFDIGGGKH
jgi:hypothetical protein